MNQITITIETLNAAFDDGNTGAEIARILRDFADKIDGSEGYYNDPINLDGTKLRDINGNKVGTVEII
jgi:hypothetical protein